MSIEVAPATVDRFADVETLLAPARPDAPACWCLSYRVSSSEFNALRGAERPARLRELCAGERPPGMLAYINGLPVGWCAFGPRTEMERLQRSRTIQKLDDVPVWSIVCFVVRTGYRRQGVARALLEGVIDYARRNGAVALESYPVDTEGRRINTSFAFVGTTGMFESAGFDRVAETSAHSGGLVRWIMRLDL